MDELLDEVERLRALVLTLAEYGKWPAVEDGGSACICCEETPFSRNGCSGPNTGRDPHADGCDWQRVLDTASALRPHDVECDMDEDCSCG